MNVGTICKRDVIGVAPETSVAEAARIMRTHHVGDVLVLQQVNERRIPIGIVTDRDIVVEVVAADLDANNLKVGDLVTRQLVTADERETCEDTVRVMAMNGVRRMPVVDESGALVGVVSIDDLLPHFAAPLAQLSELAARGRKREMEMRR